MAKFEVTDTITRTFTATRTREVEAPTKGEAERRRGAFWEGGWSAWPGALRAALGHDWTLNYDQLGDTKIVAKEIVPPKPPPQDRILEFAKQLADGEYTHAEIEKALYQAWGRFPCPPCSAPKAPPATRFPPVF